MIDFTNPTEIAAWFKVNPAKHGPQLAAMSRLPLFAEFRDAIRLAGALLKAMPK